MNKRFAELSKDQQTKIVEQLSEDELIDLLFDWHSWARPEQIAPNQNYDIWAIIAGRGFGKTRTGAEWTNEQARLANYPRFALVGPTTADVRDVMIDGESGILACAHPKFRPVYTPSKRHKLEWPNGFIANGYSAEEPDRLRGPQHGGAWGDEIAAWRYWETYDQLEYGLRLGANPVTCLTTTPKPRKELIDLLNESTTIVTKGTTLDNKFNLPKKFIDRIVNKYAGTRLGRQEIYAELLDEWEGALWRRKWIDDYRINPDETGKVIYPSLKLIVVGVDPAVTNKKTSAETGIVAAGLGDDGRYYVLDDRSLIDSPENWARISVNLVNDLQGDYIVAEVNNGGDLVETVINMHNPDFKVRKVWASRGKQVRAEPITMLYEQGKVSHVGYFADLESEMCTWDPTDTRAPSPNRIDALVWALSHLQKRNYGNDEVEIEIMGTLQTASDTPNNGGQLTEPDW